MTGIYPFDHPHGAPPRELVDLLGGKGAGLAGDSYRRFLTMYATTVMEVPADALADADADADGVRALQARIAEHAGRPVPGDPMVQLREAVEAVFRSWDSERARHYRAKE